MREEGPLQETLPRLCLEPPAQLVPALSSPCTKGQLCKSNASFFTNSSTCSTVWLLALLRQSFRHRLKVSLQSSSSETSHGGYLLPRPACSTRQPGQTGSGKTQPFPEQPKPGNHPWLWDQRRSLPARCPPMIPSWLAGYELPFPLERKMPTIREA